VNMFVESNGMIYCVDISTKFGYRLLRIRIADEAFRFKAYDSTVRKPADVLRALEGYTGTEVGKLEGKRLLAFCSRIQFG
jgi:hypothetical protein